MKLMNVFVTVDYLFYTTLPYSNFLSAMWLVLSCPQTHVESAPSFWHWWIGTKKDNCTGNTVGILYWSNFLGPSRRAITPTVYSTWCFPRVWAIKFLAPFARSLKQQQCSSLFQKIAFLQSPRKDVS
jgi:hypothetical protein